MSQPVSAKRGATEPEAPRRSKRTRSSAVYPATNGKAVPGEIDCLGLDDIDGG